MIGEARDLFLGIGADRAASGRLIERRFSPGVFLLDGAESFTLLRKHCFFMRLLLESFRDDNSSPKKLLAHLAAAPLWRMPVVGLWLGAIVIVLLLIGTRSSRAAKLTQKASVSRKTR